MIQLRMPFKLELSTAQVTYWVQGQGSFGSHGSRVNKSDPVSSLKCPHTSKVY